ncbi:hypothetical protein [Melissococcus plutonius]
MSKFVKKKQGNILFSFYLFLFLFKFQWLIDQQFHLSLNRCCYEQQSE